MASESIKPRIRRPSKPIDTLRKKSTRESKDSRPLIHLDFNDKSSSVYIDAQKGDRFLLTVQEAVHACGAWSRMAEFQIQMQLLMNRLGKWIADHRAKVKDAYFTVRGSGLFFLVVAKSANYDDELESAMTELDLEIANADDFSLLNLEVLAIPNSPPECVQAFVGSMGKSNG